MFWNLYFIFVPICVLTCWATFTLRSDRKVHWKAITIGEFLLSLFVGLIPILNIGATLFCGACTLYDSGWFNKPLFK